MSLPDIDLIEYCRLMWADNKVSAKSELQRIASECARLDKEHPHQWFSFFADITYLSCIASEVYYVYESEIRVGDRYTKPDLPIGMIVDREERESVVVKYNTHSVCRAIDEPMD